MTDIDVYLEKWPRLVVAGKKVTPDQAAEINIRTSSVYYLYSNDKAWEAEVKAILGVTEPEDHPRGDTYLRGWLDNMNKVRAELGILELEYLYNSNIISSYIGGPHGWCSWTGWIGTSSYNIGKWPTAADVYGEWTRIAEAFPYLDLRAQLIPDEGEADGPAIEYVVKDGQVEAFTQDLQSIPITEEPSITRQVMDLIYNPARERGCTAEQLRAAVDLTRARVAGS